MRGSTFSRILLSLLLPVICSVRGYGQDEPPLPGSGSAYRQAERLFAEAQYERALRVCSMAIDDVLPDRIYNRFQAMAARCCLQLNRRDEALRRVELIWQRDATSSYLSLVPLVWDDRVPNEERCASSADELKSSSPLRRLAAASSLLQEPQLTDQCLKVMTSIRAKRRPPLTILAQAQLWRVKASKPDETPLQIVQRWQKQAALLPRNLRAGPQYVVGRAFQLRYKQDRAVPELLWAPIMASDDPVLAASGLAEAVLCLESTGRSESARRLRRELQQRFGRTSAARRLTDAGATQPDPRAAPAAPTSKTETDR